MNSKNKKKLKKMCVSIALTSAIYIAMFVRVHGSKMFNTQHKTQMIFKFN